MHLVNPEAVLETERLYLEPLQRHHANLLFLALQDERIYHYIPQDPPQSLNVLAQRYHKLQTRLSNAGDEAWLNWAVRLKTMGQYVGQVEATVLAGYTGYLAYKFFPNFWGQGYAAEACRRVLQLLVIDYGVSLVIAEVDVRNTASIRLLERLGFRQVGYRADVDFFKDSSSDEYTYHLALQP